MKVTVRPILNEILKERGWTQKKLVEMTGINQATISRFDSQSRFDANHLFTIAKVLELQIEDLFEEISEE